MGTFVITGLLFCSIDQAFARVAARRADEVETSLSLPASSVTTTTAA